MANDVGVDDGGRAMVLSHCRAAFPGAARTPNLAGAGRRARICIRRLRGVRRAVTFWHQAPRLHNMRIRIPYGRAARLASIAGRRREHQRVGEEPGGRMTSPARYAAPTARPRTEEHT